MAKIRALKPEFFTDEKVVEVSPLARLLYQGMWVHSCDHGHLPDKPRQLKLRILPADDSACRARIGVLEKAGPAGNRTLTARPQPIRPGGNGL